MMTFINIMIILLFSIMLLLFISYHAVFVNVRSFYFRLCFVCYQKL